MSYIELYSEEILDLVSTGQTDGTFNESNGDYIILFIWNYLF